MPGSRRMRYVIAYDISDDSDRARLAHLLLDYGDRVQKSVFEADLDADEVKEILSRASNYINIGDSLRLYPTCKTCKVGVRSLGRSVPPLSQSLRII